MERAQNERYARAPSTNCESTLKTANNFVHSKNEKASSFLSRAFLELIKPITDLSIRGN